MGQQSYLWCRRVPFDDGAYRLKELSADTANIETVTSFANITKHALKAADGDGVRALRAAVRVIRWTLIAEGEIEPLPDELLPDVVTAHVARRTGAPSRPTVRARGALLP